MTRHLRACGGWLLLVVLTSAIAGCGSDSKKPPVGTLEPDKFLFERGTDNLTKKRWFTAREYFRQIVDSYPQSPYRPDAKLGIADTYLGENSAESNVLAINEYREFLSFYPTHDRAYYAQYQLGMCHFKQMHGPDRDQSETKDAIAELTKYMTLYSSLPKTPEATTAEAKQHLREAKDRYSSSEYGTGYFYYRTKWYPGAIDRFKSILKSDPEFTNRDAVYFYLAQSLVKVRLPAEALTYLDRLLKEFEHSEYLEETRKLAESLKAELTKKTEGKSYAP
jgi:outer membrane protein assembly factor BamD